MNSSFSELNFSEINLISILLFDNKNNINEIFETFNN